MGVGVAAAKLEQAESKAEMSWPIIEHHMGTNAK
jgi:hypothetical protein